MTGTKASFLEGYCRSCGHAFVRFDYFGHGGSSGDIALGTIGRWADDAVAVLDALTKGRQIIVGSSMGGWVMLLAALARAIMDLTAHSISPIFISQGDRRCSFRSNFPIHAITTRARPASS